MPPGPHHEVANLKAAPGELSFEARIGGRVQQVWMRSETPVIPPADAALATCLMPAMRDGGTLTMPGPVSPRLLRTQREFQAIQCAWSFDWEFGEPPLRVVDVVAPTRTPKPPETPGRIAAFFSGGVDSWSTILANPDITDLIFVRGFDLLPGLAHQENLADRVEERLRKAAAELRLPLHVVATNLRELSDPISHWETYYSSAVVAVAHFLSPLFERVLIAGESDYEAQFPFGASWMIDHLLGTEQLEIVDDGGGRSRVQRLAAISPNPIVQRSLRVCWETSGGAYNCGGCSKCLLTMTALEALGTRSQISTFPRDLDLDAVAAMELRRRVLLSFWEDVLDAARAGGRPRLERAVSQAVTRGKELLDLPPSYRHRKAPGPPPPVRIAVVIPAWRQGRYLAGAIESALAQELNDGVGVVVVNDGCPEPETDRIGQAFRDAHPDRVAYLRQPNGGVSAARNAGIRQAFARWPQVETVFPLDADNLLGPQTLAKLSSLLEKHPEAAWASPALELFGAEEGEWSLPGPYLPYRQLFMNQCDTGSLIRRAVFADVEYDESIRYGFEDWELFLRATLAGYRGFLAGPCGFRYRCRPESMLKGAQERADLLEAEIRRRHPSAFEPAGLRRQEHAEAPRFALVRCDRGDALLTASCDLEPRRLSITDFARMVAAAGVPTPTATGHVPAITLLTTADAIERLEAAGLLADTLFRIQAELRGRGVTGLRVGASPATGLAGLAVRASALEHLAGGLLPQPETAVEVELQGEQPAELQPEVASRPAALIGAAARGEGWPLPALSNPSFLEYMHIEERRTTFPSDGENAGTQSKPQVAAT
jgi:Glycosyl transferase family 2